ncbi:MAG: ComEC family competence protein [Patescibacteria group bacterium]|nr:ComEC/Rec2 family competence protein [Patescibacteria group bacterium]MDE1988796.1 ComEC family competence protein [Patescibacteria group bacterium]MDE2217937.1 ComEC family competence protein [Patescibacteria group bacterium]
MGNLKPFYIFAFGFTGGVFLNSFHKMGFSFFLLSLVIALAVFIYGKFLLADAVNKKTIFLASFFIFAFALGLLRYEIKDLPARDAMLDKHLGQKVLIEGVVLDEPDKRENGVKLTLNFKNLVEDGKIFSAKGRGIMITDFYPEYRYGDLLKIEGKLQKPKNFQSENGKSFDYASYLAKDDILYEIAFPKVELISQGNGNFIKTKLYEFKNIFIGNFSQSIPEPHSSLLSGLLLGAKQSLGKDLLADFRKAGVIHIVVLSGYNITIVAEAIMSAFSFLPKFGSISLGALGIILFAIMTGGSATVIRASAMALLVVLAKATRRQYDITRALIIVGLFMLIQNPKILVFDSSFQLSFLATLALIYVSPIVEKKLQFIPAKFKLREFATATVSTQIFVLPLLLYKMGELSLVGLPVNILILAFIPLTMLFGFLTGAISFISVALSIPFAFASYAFLSYELKVVEIFSSLPFASISVPYSPAWLMVGIYFVYGIIIHRITAENIKN